MKNPLEYEPDEEIIFKIRPKFMDNYIDVPFVFYTLISDCGKSEENYIKSGGDGWLYIKTSASESGFIYITAKACDENKNIIEEINAYNGSAGVDVKNILRAVEIPEDYAEFWNKLKKETDNIEPEILFCERIESKNYSGFEIYDMRIKAPGSEYISVMTAFPKNSLKNRYTMTIIK